MQLGESFPSPCKEAGKEAIIWAERDCSGTAFPLQGCHHHSGILDPILTAFVAAVLFGAIRS